MLENIILGASVAFAPESLLMALLGTILGIGLGALPGISTSMAIAVLIPFTFGMGAAQALIFLVTIYIGSMYGGSITSILLSTPGTPAHAASVIDGYQMTKQGRAHEALKEASVADFWGGIISLLILFLVAPPLATFSLRFGPMETFMLAVFGLTIIASLGSKNILKALISGVFGLLIGAVGMDRLIGFERYTFGQIYFQTGFQLIPVLIGLFSISQVLIMVSETKHSIVDVSSTLKNIKDSRFQLRELVLYPRTYLRSAIIGTVIGIIPGPGGNIASFMGYNEARRNSKNPGEFGKGCREGVAGPETANSAVCCGAMVPLLTLGIPGNAVTAILLGGLMIHGLTPGSAMFTTHAGVTYGLFLGLAMANVLILIIGINCAKYIAHIARVPTNILVPVIAILCIVGSFAIANSMLDVYVMIAFGILGYFMRRFGYDAAPMVLGIILGPIGESGLMRGVQIFRGVAPALAQIFQRPITLTLLILSILSLITAYWIARKERKKAENMLQQPQQ